MTAYRKYLRQVGSSKYIFFKLGSFQIAHLLKTDGNLTRSESEMNADIEKIIDFEIELAKVRSRSGARKTQILAQSACLTELQTSYNKPTQSVSACEMQRAS